FSCLNFLSFPLMEEAKDFSKAIKKLRPEAEFFRRLIEGSIRNRTSQTASPVGIDRCLSRYNDQSPNRHIQFHRSLSAQLATAGSPGRKLQSPDQCSGQRLYSHPRSRYGTG